MVLQELPVFDPRAAVSKAVEAPSRLKGAPPGGQSLPSSPDAQAGEGARQGSQATAQTQPAAGQRRALSCVRCQRRKKKCNKKSPCSNCSKINAVCVPSTPAPPRKRKKPTQDLTRRLEWCEEQLRHCQRWHQTAPDLADDGSGGEGK